MTNWANVLIAIAGLMGASGVALAAAGAHAGGANLATAATFLLIHATAVMAVALHGGSTAFLLAASLLAAGACLFAGDIAVRAWGAARLFPMAAPGGGLAMMAGWLCLSVAAILAQITRP